MSAHDFALLLATRKIPTFPCLDNKKPACLHGFKNATYDLAALNELWRAYPGTLVGVPTGEKFVILDLDFKHQEAQVWHRETPLPETRTHMTQSGGMHLFFAPHPFVKNSTSKIAKGVDTRGEGGYIIWWPQQGFQILNPSKLAPVPEVVLAGLAPKLGSKPVVSRFVQMRNEFLRTRGTRGNGGNPEAKLRGILDAVAKAHEGERNNFLNWGAYRISQMLANGEVDDRAAAEALDDLAMIGIEIGLPQYEVERTIKSATEAK